MSDDPWESVAVGAEIPGLDNNGVIVWFQCNVSSHLFQ